jgi:hypothetical protein
MSITRIRNPRTFLQAKSRHELGLAVARRDPSELRRRHGLAGAAYTKNLLHRRSQGSVALAMTRHLQQCPRQQPAHAGQHLG